MQALYRALDFVFCEDKDIAKRFLWSLLFMHGMSIFEMRHQDLIYDNTIKKGMKKFGYKAFIGLRIDDLEYSTLWP